MGRTGGILCNCFYFITCYNSSMPKKKESVKEQLSGKGFENNPQNINREGAPPKTHWWTTLLIAEAERDSEKMEKLKRKEVMARALVEKAEAGDIQALKEFGDRVQGKSIQPTDLTSQGEKITGVTLTVVKSAAES